MNEALYSYLVVEIQTSADGSVATLCTPKSDYFEAESVYHMVLGAAALSSLPLHSAVLLDNHGVTIERKDFQHFNNEQEEE